ncbi:MAG: MarR family transcriptional regulator [Pseudonocardiales bacterium]|nr:MAG: MarR family transcriptional regulator [Pseudonocardiales bacterium]
MTASVPIAGTRWLDEDEQRAWRAYLEATLLFFDALDRQMQQDSGMPHAYYEILVRLSETDGHSMRMSELAVRTRSSRSRLSHAIDRLEERGWVERADCPTDRRGQLAHLTDHGFAVLAAAAPSHVAVVRKHVIDQLSPEQIRQLTDIGTTIINGLEADDRVG